MPAAAGGGSASGSSPPSADGVEMTPALLSRVCRDAGLPTSPLATTQLYLSCCRFRAIAPCIRAYTEVESIWLEVCPLRAAN